MTKQIALFILVGSLGWWLYNTYQQYLLDAKNAQG